MRRTTCAFVHILPGIQLKKAWGAISKIDSELEARLPYAYNTRLGYLYRLPHQPGHGHEGLRDDAPAGPRHLRTDATGRPGGRAAQHHCPRPVRRRDGSHRQPLQISNQTTLGDSEDQIVERMTRFTSDLAHQEMGHHQQLSRLLASQ